MGEWECRRADQPFLQAAEEVAIQVTAVEPSWVAAAVALWLALALGAADPAFAVVASCAAD